MSWWDSFYYIQKKHNKNAVNHQLNFLNTSLVVQCDKKKQMPETLSLLSSYNTLIPGAGGVIRATQPPKVERIRGSGM